MGELLDMLFIFLWFDVLFNLIILQIIFFYFIGLVVVGLFEFMMIVIIVDDLMDIKSDKNCECKGQGIVNIGVGLMGGMVGCVMIGQFIINVKFGGWGCLLMFIVGIFLLIMVVFLDEWIK